MTAQSSASKDRSLGPLWALLLCTLAAWGLLHLFPGLRLVFFLTFFGLVLASIFEYPIGFLARWLPRPLATFATFILLVGIGAGLGFMVVPSFIEQARRIVDAFPAAVNRGSELLRGLPGDLDAGEWIERASQHAGAVIKQVVPAAVAAVSALGTALITILLGFFLAHAPREYLSQLLRLVPSGRMEAFEQTVLAGARTLRGWLLGVLVSMTVVGVLTGLGLLLIGVDLWLALGLLAFFGAFVPFLGAILTAIPGVVVGLADSPMMALKVLLVYVIVQQIEGNLAQPLAMRWAVRIPPALLLAWQIAFTAAFGLGGLLVATPLLAALKGAVGRGYVERTLGKEPEAAPQQAEAETRARRPDRRTRAAADPSRP